MVQPARIFHRGSYGKRGGNLPLRAVGGRIDQLLRAALRILCHKGRGTAAIQIHRILGADGFHKRAKLAHGHAVGAAASAVHNGEIDRLLVAADAECGARINSANCVGKAGGHAAVRQDFCARAGRQLQAVKINARLHLKLYFVAHLEVINQKAVPIRQRRQYIHIVGHFDRRAVEADFLHNAVTDDHFVLGVARPHRFAVKVFVEQHNLGQVARLIFPRNLLAVPVRRRNINFIVDNIREHVSAQVLHNGVHIRAGRRGGHHFLVKKHCADRRAAPGPRVPVKKVGIDGDGCIIAVRHIGNVGQVVDAARVAENLQRKMRLVQIRFCDIGPVPCPVGHKNVVACILHALRKHFTVRIQIRNLGRGAGKHRNQQKQKKQETE